MTPKRLDQSAEAISNPFAQEVAAGLSDRGYALLPALLAPQDCAALVAMYAEPRHFRSRVVMAQHGFGRGEYQYFNYPLPAHLQSLRSRLYSALVAVANAWQAALGLPVRFPPDHADFLERCHAAGQTRPTPLLLQYGEGDYNCLHQDLYGDHMFPIQATFMLSRPGDDFTGGEFVLAEQRPRMQSRAEVVPLTQGDAVVFAGHQRPVQGRRGSYRVNLRHGVSRVHTGHRHTLGVILHDAL